ncbi:Na+/H+ antiporter subunit E [Salinibacterium sp. dk2585]|uniref:Na+/H+ antiporter subunit E n=1 Tax=unclassified Salinibacterium TaxID=2632331 RepID=UPI0011C25502|nr:MULTISPECIES: Na+/H+ antiporter subunit E [unclassified Salinibacterium]QEE60904.1 Na+/H+ antiporter subunit E [Salinibacterium sp. dk2585]TXK55975.1 Na+/H+ antiporter subunit E [Salinibacterium sp. dk5596]
MPEYTSRRLRRNFFNQLPLLVWLVVLWMLLWGSLSWLNLVTGILVALIVMRVFYLPPVELSGRFNLLWAVVFVVVFLWDVIRGSFHVAWIAVNPRRRPASSVIAVHLNSRSDLVMLLVSLYISLVPGSLVVEADRYRSVLYIHALDVHDDASLERTRATVLAAERRIVRVIGSRDDLRRSENAGQES